MKLSLDALKERAEATASTELLATITGGNENACHDVNLQLIQAQVDADLKIANAIVNAASSFWNWLTN